MSDEKKISVTVDGIRKSAESGILLSELTLGEKPCGGHGRCGKCKVVAHGVLSEISDRELSLLTEEEIARGVRLACMTHALGDCRIESAEHAGAMQILTSAEVGPFKKGQKTSVLSKKNVGKAQKTDESKENAEKTSVEGLGVAIDIGTTTLAATLMDREGRRLATVGRLNPQSRWGADVVSRIEASMAGARDAMASAIRAAIDGMLCQLCTEVHRIERVVITGNTVMLALLCGDDTEPFSHAPFAVSELYGRVLPAGQLSLSALSPDTEVYLPPCISAFVGADTVCALLATGPSEGLMVDIGTNGEIALLHGGRLTVCSTAAGPAFEGVGISMGMRGEKGAIDRVMLVNGTLHCHVIGDVSPCGVCGSGLVDAVACLLRMGEIEESGYMEEDEVTLAGAVTLSAKDVRAVQLAKSAISAGMKTLVHEAGLELSEVKALRIAGGFGSYLDSANASYIGLLPRALSNGIEVCGNAALSGAELLLWEDDARTHAAQIAHEAELCELATSKVFAEHYMMGMTFEEE